jgi:hypothetical protein
VTVRSSLQHNLPNRCQARPNRLSCAAGDGAAKLDWRLPSMGRNEHAPGSRGRPAPSGGASSPSTGGGIPPPGGEQPAARAAFNPSQTLRGRRAAGPRRRRGASRRTAKTRALEPHRRLGLRGRSPPGPAPAKEEAGRQPGRRTGSHKGPAPAVRARGRGSAAGAGAHLHGPRLRPPGGLASLPP